MKKLILISLIFAVSSFITRADYGLVKFYKVSTPFIIDADTADWNSIPAISVMQRYGGIAQAGFYSRTKLAWDNDNIYILNIVTDPDRFDGNGNTSSWNNDCVELFFHFGPDTSSQPRTNTDYDFWQIRYQWSNEFLDGEKGAAMIDSTTDLSGMHRKQKTTTTGYVMEWQIPWSDLTSQFIPEANALFRFDEQTADATTSGKGRVASYFISNDPVLAGNDYVWSKAYPVGKLVATDETTDTLLSVTETNIAIKASVPWDNNAHCYNAGTIHIVSNVDWTVSSTQSWLGSNTTSGTGNTALIITASTNTGDARTGTIIVKSGRFSRSITVTQAAATYINLDQTIFSLNNNDNIVHMYVASNASWIAISDQSWLTLSQASGIGSGNLVFSCTANLSSASRTATITVSAEGISRTITVTQEGSSPVSAKNYQNPNKLIVHPNPTSGEFYIEYNINSPSNVVVELINPLGLAVKSIFKGQEKAGHFKYFASLKQQGIYFVRLTVDGNQYVEKVVRNQ